jgi:hypothetical protein
MTRLCVIGDSHLAAIKLGWEVVKSEFPHVQVDFFGSGGASLADTAIDQGRLIPTVAKVRRGFEVTSGGKDCVRLSDYDVVIIVGVGYSIYPLLWLYQRYRSEDHANNDCPFTPVSSAFFREVAASRLAGTVAVQLHDKIRKASKTYLKIVPQPLPSDAVLDSHNQSGIPALLKSTVAYHDDITLAHYFTAVTGALVKEGRQISSPPTASRSGYLFTKREFSVGSVRLSKNLATPHDEDDFEHMNKEYGALQLRELLASPCLNLASQHPA